MRSGDGKVSSENLVEGTHDDMLVLPTGEVPATGGQFGGKYVGTFEIAGGRIVAQHVYYDRMIVVEQLLDRSANSTTSTVPGPGWSVRRCRPPG